MRQTIVSGLLAILVLGSAGCTIRYSQTLVGSIERISDRPVTNSDSGFEIGLSQQAGIAFSEPTHAADLLELPCDVAMTQVDYRGIWFAFYLSFNFPETETVSYCVSN